MQIGLLLTSRCNAACTHCATSCGPDKTAALSRPDLFRVMDQAAAIDDGRPLVFSLSGGEAFLDFALLRELVAYGRKLGGETTCVTNGYWATTDDRARSMLAELRDAGLRALGVSTSRYHQRYVKLTRVQRALRIAHELGMETVIKYAQVRGDEAQVEELQAWAKDLGVTRFELFPVLPYVREGAAIAAADLLLDPGLPEGRCPIPSITLREDGTAYSCCAPGGFVDFLSLGSALEDGVEQVHRRFWLNGKQRLLREHGPIHFAREIQARGLGDRLRPAYAGVCDLCAHISADPELAAIAQEQSERHEEEYLVAALEEMQREVPA